jgi:rubrerythrin
MAAPVTKRIYAFQKGYQFGLSRKNEISPREAIDLFPEFTMSEIDAFLNGVQDGVENDNSRIQLVEQLEARLIPRVADGASWRCPKCNYLNPPQSPAHCHYCGQPRR